MISYRLKYNRYRYFSSTGIPRIPSRDHAFGFMLFDSLHVKPYAALCSVLPVGDDFPRFLILFIVSFPKSSLSHPLILQVYFIVVHF